jgi:hypothetical protein
MTFCNTYKFFVFNFYIFKIENFLPFSNLLHSNFSFIFLLQSTPDIRHPVRADQSVSYIGANLNDILIIEAKTPCLKLGMSYIGNRLYCQHLKIHYTQFFIFFHRNPNTQNVSEQSMAVTSHFNGHSFDAECDANSRQNVPTLVGSSFVYDSHVPMFYLSAFWLLWNSDYVSSIF